MKIKPAFSFLYDGKDNRELLPKWKQSTRRSRRRGVKVCVTTWRNPKGLEVEQEELRFSDSSAVEWVLRFRNRGRKASGIFSEIMPLDLTLVTAPTLAEPYPDGLGNSRPCNFRLHYSTGGLAGAHDYEPHVQNLGRHGAPAWELSAGNGRSSNRHLPFFNLQTAVDAGVIAAVGWSGQWQARFEITAEDTLRVRAGMQLTHLRLLPGEEIRSPRIALLPWQGTLADGHNQWRRFLRQQHSLPLGGEEPYPQTWCNTWFTFNEGCGVDESNQSESIIAAGKLGIETLTIDAGWYEHTRNWWDGVGSWVPRADAFPEGFRPVADAGRKQGIRLGVWYECERAFRDTRVTREHPEFIMALPQQGDNPHFLVNLGLPAAQDWFINLVSGHVEQGVRWFRHDFNIDPLPYWQAADAEDRQGLTEIRYVEGLYRVYDELHRRYPDLIIEGCASGGRRIDLETIGRNHGYWATDMMCGTPEPMQAHIHGFNLYLLPHVHNTVLREQNAPKADTPADRYRFFSFLGGSPCLCFDVREPFAFDGKLCRRWLQVFRDLRHLTMGDFYPLTEYSLSNEVWYAVQFHRDDLDEGLVMVFRRPHSPYSEATFTLQGLTARAKYKVTEVLDRKATTKTGKALSSLTITLAHAPDMTLRHYRHRS